MSVWGYENFDSDYALDMLGVWIQKIVDVIRETFTHESHDTVYGRHGDSHIVANVDIIVTLCQHYKIYPDLELDEVIKWKQDYLKTYDTVISYTDADSIAFAKKRREVIVKTFDLLHSIVSELHSDEL
jgi:hypothetical protein